MSVPVPENQPAYKSFRPRPDQPERYDQQQAFYDSSHSGVTFIVGGNGSGTSEVGLAKVARFLMETPPPRKDTPFWIISASYEMVCKACWKEKLCPRGGHGHLCDSEVDWERIRWYRPNLGWPFEVPLKPWPGRPGKNWSVCFKSYEQGRQQMQAESIGGFLFVEQFPWGLLEEVVRGCREYNYPGSKLCEFTPVDPALSVELETLIEEDRLPEGWAVYRANTECAMEAGHVSESWFREFFGMVSEEMRETRMTGQFATYEGAIYQNFNPLVHLVGDDAVFPRKGNFPQNIYHRRAIDWGSGPDNAMCCLWGYKNSLGQWFMYDEYYSTDQEYTVHDHLKQIHDRWHWPRSSPHYGMTFADPSEPGYIRIASKLSSYHRGYDDLAIQNANNRVYEGIDHVRSLLKCSVTMPDGSLQPRLFIHKPSCPNLSRQMRTYRWERSSGQGLNPRDARPQPLKRDDHAVDALRYLVFSDSDATSYRPETLHRDRSRIETLVPGVRRR